MLVKRISLVVFVLCLTITFFNSDYAYSEISNDTSSVKTLNKASRTISFRDLYQRIYSGKATLEQVKLALTTKDSTKLVNTMHALYAMRWHAGVHNLLYKMWEIDKDEAPKISWDLIEKPPVRIALASTINRIDILKSKDIREYIRSFKYDDDVLNRGQALVALGLNGDPVDVPYLEEMADSNNRYLTQIGVSSLAFMENSTAKESLISLAKKHYDTPRGKLILDVLSRSYNVVPVSKEEYEKANAEENIN
ncbi:MAG: HEAT repeat domain-containing protein [Proteobacteria bacterium]|nr:hypothetical protein [Pseudomonadota bacterium]NOG61625.1 HEAT repeat domain-containing protein [Pseudomonadota bacterium]